MNEVINDYLKSVGLTPSGEPLFRLVWSDSQHEPREGVFDEYYGSVYIGTVVGVRDVPKYPRLKARWILEMWRSGAYEYLYVFEDARGNALPLSLRVVELIVHFTLEKQRKAADIERAIRDELERKEEAEDRRCEDIIDASPIQNALHLKEGEAYGGVCRR